MAMTIYEAPGRSGVDGGDSPAHSRLWIVTGTDDQATAAALVRITTPAKYGNLFLRDVNAKEIADQTWECEARYGAKKPPTELEYKFSFDTTGGKQKITQSLATIHKYAPTGETAADHKGAIGVTAHGVEGCEIVVPAFSWSETWQLPIAVYGWEYSQTLKDITGKVNDLAFRGFPTGQVLFRGGKGSASTKDPALIEITFSFDQSDDVRAKTIGDISGINKGGWQYLWVHYAQKHDTTADVAGAATG